MGETAFAEDGEAGSISDGLLSASSFARSTIVPFSLAGFAKGLGAPEVPSLFAKPLMTDVLTSS